MKNIKFSILMLIFLLITSNLSAQDAPFTINGSISGAKSFKYVYVFDNEYKLVKMDSIIDGKYQISGKYALKPRFGEMPYAKVLLSNEKKSEGSIRNERMLSDRALNNCKVVMGEPVTLNYNSDSKVFKITGGPMNAFQSKFMENLCWYRNSRDSAYAKIDHEGLDAAQTEQKKLDEARRLFSQTLQNSIKIMSENLSSPVCLAQFSPVIYDQGTPGSRVMELFDRFSSDLKQSEYGQQLLLDINDKLRQEAQLAKPPYTVGMTFPKFDVPDGKDVKTALYSKLGKYTLIDFWATWCGPCRKETPNLIKAFNQYGVKDFKVITVSIDAMDDKAKWVKALDEDHMGQFINLFNGNDLSGIARELKIVAIPTNYLVDQEGKIVARNLRGEDLVLKLKELYKD